MTIQHSQTYICNVSCQEESKASDSKGEYGGH
jgi:hypothetical protein